MKLLCVLLPLLAGARSVLAASLMSEQAVAAFAALPPAKQEVLVPLLEHAQLSVAGLRAKGLKKALCEQVLRPIGLVSGGAAQIDQLDEGLRQVIYNALNGQLPLGQAFFQATVHHPELLNYSDGGTGKVRYLPRYIHRRAVGPALGLVERQVEENLAAVGVDANTLSYLVLAESVVHDSQLGGFRLRVHLRADADDMGISLYTQNWREETDNPEWVLAQYISAALLHRHLLGDAQEFLREIHFIRYQLFKLIRVAHREWRAAIRNLVVRLPVVKEDELRTAEQWGDAFSKYLRVKADLILLYQYRLHWLSNAARTEQAQGSRLALPFHIGFVRDAAAQRSVGTMLELKTLLRNQGYYLPDQSANMVTRGFLKGASHTLKPDSLFLRSWFRGRINSFHLVLQSLADLVFFAGANRAPGTSEPPAMSIQDIFPLLGRDALVQFREDLAVVMLRPQEPLYFTGNDRPVLDVWSLDDMRPDRSSLDVYLPPLPLPVPTGLAILPDHNAFATELLDLRKVRSVAEMTGVMLRGAGLEPDEEWAMDEWDASGLPDDLLAERKMRELREAPPPPPPSSSSRGTDASVINQIMGAMSTSIPSTPPPDTDGYDGSSGAP